MLPNHLPQQQAGQHNIVNTCNQLSSSSHLAGGHQQQVVPCPSDEYSSSHIPDEFRHQGYSPTEQEFHADISQYSNVLPPPQCTTETSFQSSSDASLTPTRSALTPVPMEVSTSSLVGSASSPHPASCQLPGSSQLVSSIQETRPEFSFHNTQQYLDNIKEMV